MNTNLSPALITVAIASVIAGCQPVEYAEDLTPSVLELRHYGYTFENAEVSIFAKDNDTPVWEGTWSSSTKMIDPFRVPDGEYRAELRHDLDGDGRADSAQSYFDYQQRDGGSTGFSSLEFLANQVGSCFGSEGATLSDQSGVIEAVKTTFLVAPYLGPQNDQEELYLSRTEAALDSVASDLEVTKLQILNALADDIEIDCDLNSATENPDTGAVKGVDLDDEPFNAEATLSKLATAIVDIGISENNPTTALTRSILDSSNGVFKASGTTNHDLTGPTATAVTDLTPSLFGQVQLQFQIDDNVGVDSVAVSLQGDAPSSEAYIAKTGLYSMSFDVSSMADGVTTLDFVLEDVTGNISYQQFAVTIDNTGPAVSLQDPTYTNQVTPTATVQAIPASGSVISVEVDGTAFTNTSNDLWSGAVSLTTGKNDLVATVETSFGLTKQVTLITYLDQQAPNLTLAGSATPISNSDGSGASVSSDIVVDLNGGFHLDYRQTMPYLLGVEETTTALNAETIAYITPTTTDQAGTGQSEQEDISLWYRFNTPSVTGEWQSLDNGEDTLSLTRDRLGQKLVEMNVSDVGDLDFRAIDLAGNETTVSVDVRAYFDRHNLVLTSENLTGNIGLDLMDAGNRFEVATCTANTSGCSLPILLFDRAYAFDQSGLTYVDYLGNSVDLSEEADITNLPLFARPESYEFSPYLYLVTAVAKYERSLGSDYNTALNNAVTRVESDFVGITSAPFSNLSMISGYDAQAEATILRAGLARAAQRIEGESGSSCTVFNLAGKIASDYSDNGMLDASLNTSTAGCDNLSPTEARQFLAAGARDEMIDQDLVTSGDAFDDIGRRFWTPVAPTLQSNVSTGIKSGEVYMAPTSTAKTEYAVVDILLNNVVIKTVQRDDSFIWDSTSVPNGSYVLDFELVDGYFQTDSERVFITVDN